MVITVAALSNVFRRACSPAFSRGENQMQNEEQNELIFVCTKNTKNAFSEKGLLRGI